MARRVCESATRWRSIRFATLTLRANSRSLSDRFDDIDAAFKALREMPVWRDNVRSAMATPEITRGKRGQWHLHLHILWDGDFVPHAQLKAAWYKATGDSFIVDVRAVHDREKAARYIAGYVSKPADVAKWTEEQIREFSMAMHGRRLLRSYGVRHAEVNEVDDSLDTPAPSTFVCDVNAFLKANDVSPVVRHAREVLARLGVSYAHVLHVPEVDRSLPPVSEEELSFAMKCAQCVNAAFPAIPDESVLEGLRSSVLGVERMTPIKRRLRCEQMELDLLLRPYV